jgi:hypothetical protein
MCRNALAVLSASLPDAHHAHTALAEDAQRTHVERWLYRWRSMESLVALQYPNGRTHETSVTTSHELEPGGRFDLHGRHWRVVGLVLVSRSAKNAPGRMRCLSVGDIALEG